MPYLLYISSSKTGVRVTLVWLCLLVRLLFYASTFPLWEGVDEWAHFAVVQSVALRGEWLPDRNRPIPRNIEASLRIVPLPWDLRRFDAPSVTHDAYWQLPEQQRRERIEALRAIPQAWAFEGGSGAFSNYEAQQPPVYYWLAAPIVWLLRDRGLATQVMAVRWFNVLLASLVVPLVYRIGREIFDDERLALGCAVVITVMPGFASAAARVGNEALAAPLYAALILSGLVLPRRPALIAVLLGLGLLTKAYFLTAIPPVLWLIVRSSRKTDRSRGRQRAVALAFLIPLALAGWWYVRNLVTTGTLAGLGEDVAVQKTNPWAALHALPSVPWWRAIDAILFSHLYCLGWSWLTVRSWMYHVLYVAIAAAAIGLWRWRRNPAILWLLGIYLFFWLGNLWHAALMYASRGMPTSLGYYLYGVVAAQAPLWVAGLATWLRRWAAAVLAAMFAALDLAAMHLLAIPYYTGAIRHQPDGTLHFAHAVAVHFSPLWLLYVAATLGVVLIALRKPPAPATTSGKAGFEAY